MSRRSLAILSEGMLSDSQRRTLTLLSLGWLELTYVPEEDDDTRRRRGGGGTYYRTPYDDRWEKKAEILKREDEEIFAIISTFIEWEA
jgi:hypothetical protein